MVYNVPPGVCCSELLAFGCSSEKYVLELCRYGQLLIIIELVSLVVKNFIMLSSLLQLLKVRES